MLKMYVDVKLCANVQDISLYVGSMNNGVATVGVIDMEKNNGSPRKIWKKGWVVAVILVVIAVWGSVKSNEKELEKAKKELEYRTQQ